MANSNGFTDIALQEVRQGKKTVEQLERMLDILSMRTDEMSQRMIEGLQAALEILRA